MLQTYQNKTRQFSIVKRIIDSMKFLPDLAKVYLTIVDVVIDETEAENCSLMLLDSDTGKLVVKAAKGKRDRKGRYYDQEWSLGGSFEISEGIAGKVAKEGKSFLIADTTKEKLFVELNESHIQIRSLLCIPVFNKNKVIGVFNLSSSQPGVFNRNDQIVVSTVAMLAATTLSTSLLYEKLQELNEKLEQKVKEKTAVLVASEHKYRALMQEANDGIFIFQDGTFKLINRCFEKMLGYSAQNFTSTNSINALFVNHIEECLHEMQRSQDKQSRSLAFEFPAVNKNGKNLQLEVGVTGVEYEGKPAIQGIVRDITLRKEMERLKTNFFAMVAHEIRTPIAVITGYNRMLLKEEAGALNPLQQQILKESKKSCNRLTNFAREIMDLFRMETGKMNLNLREEEVGVCINDALREVSSLARGKKIRLKQKRSPRGLPKIRLDKNRIQQVVINLTTNAVNHTPEGGKIEVEVLPPTENFIEVCVTDNGLGVPSEERETIFDEFIAGKRSNDKDGVGLGLTICKKIIEAHGGRIWMEPGEKAGSKFIFTLPL